MSKTLTEPDNHNDEAERDDEVFELMELIRQMYTLMNKVRTKELKPYKLRPMQMHILSTIKSIGESATPTAIANWEMRTLPTITDMLSRMEKQGLVTLSNSFPNKRLVKVSITEKGDLAYLVGRKREPIRKIIRSLNDDELAQLKNSLFILRKSCFKELEVDAPPYPSPRLP